MSKVAELCEKLATLDDGNGQSVLDNSVVFLGAAMHGSNFRCADLPALLLGTERRQRATARRSSAAGGS